MLVQSREQQEEREHYPRTLLQCSSSIKLEGNGPKDSRALDIGKKMISDSKYGFIFDISSFNYPDIHVHLVSNRQPLRPW